MAAAEAAVVLEIEDDGDSDIEITFENVAPAPKPSFQLPPAYQNSYHHRAIRSVRRQRQAFNPKPCSFCRREFRDKVTVARHTVRPIDLSNMRC
jgi:hypothetical protein